MMNAKAECLIGRTYILLALAICLISATVAGANPRAELESEVQPTTIRPGGSVSLRLQMRGDLLHAQPDLTPLEREFEIQDVGRSQRQIIVNGNRDESIEWLIQLRPLNDRNVEIPPLTVGKKKTVAHPIVVASMPTGPSAKAGQSVSRAPDGAPIFVTTEVDRANPYEQERIVLRVRVYVDAPITEATLADPQIVEGAIVDRIGEDRSFEEDLSGRHYIGIERSYAVTPMQPGAFRIAPIRFEATVQGLSLARRSRRFGGGLLDDFFGDSSFGGDLFDRIARSRGQHIAVQSDERIIHVRPRPPESQGQWWLPARNLSIQEDWSPDPTSVEVGEALTRKITVRADGASTAALPPLSLPEVAGAKQYTEAPDLQEDSVGSLRLQDTTLIPTESGSLTLPAIEIHWWDVDTDTPQVARLPARTIDVGLSSLALAPTASGNSEITPNPMPAPQATSKTLEDGSDPLAHTTETNPRAGLTTTIVLGNLLVVLALGIGAVLIWRQFLQQRFARFRAEQDLRKACQRSQPDSANRALQVLRNLADPESIADGANDRSLSKALEDLDQARYSGLDEPWDGHALWTAYRDSRRRSRDRAPHETDEFAQLYPSRGPERQDLRHPFRQY